MTRDEVYKAVQSLSREQDLFAASDFVLGLGEPQKVAAAFENLLLDCYHEVKSIAQVLHFGSAGVHFCLASALALDGKDNAAAKEIRYAAKRMATNVASFTWPGWDEPGIAISPEQMRQGLMFARYGVRQLHELDPTAAQMAFTYWFLGAQLLADGQYAEALHVFEAARASNLEAGDDPDERLMLEGYIVLAKLLAGQASCGEDTFSGAVAALRSRGTEDAQFYAQQLITARAVFATPESA